MSIPAVKLSAAQTLVANVFEKNTLGRFVKVTAMKGSPIESGIYLCSAVRGTRGCNGNTWITLDDNECGKVELDWRSAVGFLSHAEIVTSVAEIAKFFQPVVLSASVEVGSEGPKPALLAPVSTVLEAPTLNLLPD